MKTKIVYVLVSNPEDLFYEQCLISVLSLKHNMHDAEVVLVCDNETQGSMTGLRSEIIPYLSDIKVIKFDSSVSKIERSRKLKVNLRSIVNGDYLYIDCDTLIVDDLSDIDLVEDSMAAVLDGHHNLPGHPLRSYFAKQNEHLCYNFNDEEKYFSGGVIYSKDDDISKNLYGRWNDNYTKSISHGILQDEPSLCLSNLELGHTIYELGGEWNCQVRFGALYLAKAKILHFCSKRNMPVNILATKEFLYRVKKMGINTPHLQQYIQDWHQTMLDTLVLSSGYDAIFNLSKEYEDYRKKSINRNLVYNIYHPKISTVGELYRHIRNMILGRLNAPLLYRILYKEKLGISLSADDDDSLNKKIYQLAFYSDITLWSIYADKLAVREYVKSKGWESILPQIYKTWDNASKIDMEGLPLSFVFKCNHDNGSVIVIKDCYATDIEFIRKYYTSRLKRKFGILTAEPHYKFIRPLVFAEEIIENDKQFSDGLVSYNFFAFYGKTRYCQVVYDGLEYTNQKSIIYDIENWSKCPGFIIKKEGTKNIPRPETLDMMTDVVFSLSEDIPFARIDLYEASGKVYFSEITLMPAGGRISNFSKEFLKILGNKVIMPIK